MSDQYLPHQQRVVDERTELEDKRRKLAEFIDANPIFHTLTLPERGRLSRQLRAMNEYSMILQDRIYAF